MSTRSTGSGIMIALLSAASFATSGPFAKSLLETGWTPGSVVFLRIAGAALILAVPTVRALGGRWHLLREEWHQVLAYGVGAVAVPQLAFFYAVQHLSVGVALLLEYLGLVLVVAWQCLAARRLPRPPTVAGIVLALVGLALVLDLPALTQDGGLQIDGIGVAWGLFAAVGLATYFLLSGNAGDSALPPMVLAGGGLMVGALTFAVLGATGLLPMTFETAPVALAGVSAALVGSGAGAGRHRRGDGVRHRDPGGPRPRGEAGLVRGSLGGPVRRPVRLGAARRAAAPDPAAGRTVHPRRRHRRAGRGDARSGAALSG